jgi:hypothetical protein
MPGPDPVFAGLHFIGGNIDHMCVDGARLLRISRCQRAIGNDVDQPGHPARTLIQGAQRGFPEWITRRARHLHAVQHICPGFLLIERRQVVTRGNPLCELPQILALEQLPQLRLTQQNHLQQLVLGRFQVGQQAHLLQRFRAEILRLVNHDHHAAAQGMLRQQVGVERINHPLVAVPDAVRSDPQFLANRSEQFTRRHQGIKHQSHLAILRHLLHQATAQGGLTGPDFARQLDKPTRTALADTVHQVGQGIAMRRAQINK